MNSIAKAKEILRSTNPFELNDHLLKAGSERVLSWHEGGQKRSWPSDK